MSNKIFLPAITLMLLLGAVFETKAQDFDPSSMRTPDGQPHISGIFTF